MTSSKVKVAIVQTDFGDNTDKNIDACTSYVRDAANGGANIVLLPELFESQYFPQSQKEADFSLARPIQGHPTVAHFSILAKELGVVIPVSVFEKDGQEYYNSVVMLDADGSQLGVYRKSHIPDGPGYQEKFFFRPGNTGFKNFATAYANIGVGICWDQWFPEAARAMVLKGADELLYPTAIGTEPQDPELDTRDPWRRVMVGHAVANACGVAASNRIGTEGAMSFYGHSFVCNHRGDFVASLENTAGVAIGTLDIEELQRERAAFGFFRDRRPDLYQPLTNQSEK